MIAKRSMFTGGFNLGNRRLPRSAKVLHATPQSGTTATFPPLLRGGRCRGRVANRFQNALSSFPEPGGGVHQHILSCANYGVRQGLTDDQLHDRIAAAMPRDPKPNEIEDALEKARSPSNGTALSLQQRLAREQERKWGPQAAVLAVTKLVEQAGGPIALDALRAESPTPLGPLTDPDVQRQNAIRLLHHLHPETAYLFCGDTYGGQSDIDACLGWECSLEDETIPPLWIPNALTGEVALTSSGKESYRCDNTVADHRYLVYECDHEEISLEHQAAFLRSRIAGGWPIRSVTYSGGKSLHALLEVGCGSQEIWEREVKTKLKPDLVALGADPACFNPARLSRLPGHMRDGVNLQSLVWLSPPRKYK